MEDDTDKAIKDKLGNGDKTKTIEVLERVHTNLVTITDFIIPIPSIKLVSLLHTLGLSSMESDLTQMSDIPLRTASSSLFRISLACLSNESNLLFITLLIAMMPHKFPSFSSSFSLSFITTYSFRFVYSSTLSVGLSKTDLY